MVLRLVGSLAAIIATLVFTAGPTLAQRARTLTRGESRLLAQDLADAAGVSCDVSTAVALGVDDEGQWLVEATCAEGGGYLLHDARTGARAFDCLALAGLAVDDPTQQTCRVGGNASGLGLIRRFAAEAGIDCSVDQGRMIGTTPHGERVIEVGCRGVDGYRIEQTGSGGWKAVPCLVLENEGAACRYTDAKEQAETARRWLASAPGETCEVSDVRYRGYSSHGSIFEISCIASPGLLIRLDDSGRLTETLTCAAAAHIGGGCVLSTPTAASSDPPGWPGGAAGRVPARR